MRKLLKGIAGLAFAGVLVLQVPQMAQAYDYSRTIGFGYSGGIGYTPEYIKQTTTTAVMYCETLSATPIYGTPYSYYKAYLPIYENGSYTSVYSTTRTVSVGTTAYLENDRATTNTKVKIACRAMDNNAYSTRINYSIN